MEDHASWQLTVVSAIVQNLHMQTSYTTLYVLVYMNSKDFSFSGNTIAKPAKTITYRYMYRATPRTCTLEQLRVLIMKLGLECN